MFIHTFSLRKPFHYRQAEKLWFKYKIIVSSKSDEGSLAPIEIIEFSADGLRIKLYKRTPEEIKYDKAHRDIWAELIVTPYKLIYPGSPLGALSTRKEYINAIEHLEKLLFIIKSETAIDFSDAKIYRIDLTYDVITPSAIYTKELIAALKASPLAYGYEPHIPSDEVLCANQWDPGNAFLYTNHQQHFNAKIYDKVQNLLDYSQDIDFLKSKGLLRFEISLSRHYLKGKGYLAKKNILYTLASVLEDAEQIYQRHIIEPLDFGDMLSKDLLLRYLHKKAGTKQALYARMEHCVINASLSKKKGIPMENDFMGSVKSTNNILKHFRELEISPVPLASECPYAPSVSKMIEGQYSPKLLNYAKKHTNRKDYWNDEL